MSTTADIDAIMDLAAPSTDTENTENPAETAAEGSADEDSTPESTDVYPNVLRSYKAGVDAPDNGDNPEGTLTISEFAGYLTVEAFKNATAENKAVTPDLIVKDAGIYTGVKARRHALPVVLVFPADSDEQKDAKVYLPVAEATEAFRNRPERGTGASAATSKRSAEEILTDGAKKLIALRAVEARLARVLEQHKKVSAQYAKYQGWLRPFHKDADQGEFDTAAEAVDASVKAAFEAKAAELEEAAALEADAAKNADIADNA